MNKTAYFILLVLLLALPLRRVWADELAWIGFNLDSGSGWIWNEDHGYLYPGPSAWIYSHELEWIWAQEDSYPWIYSDREDQWLWRITSNFSDWYYFHGDAEWRYLPRREAEYFRGLAGVSTNRHLDGMELRFVPHIWEDFMPNDPETVGLVALVRVEADDMSALGPKTDITALWLWNEDTQESWSSKLDVGVPRGVDRHHRDATSVLTSVGVGPVWNVGESLSVIAKVKVADEGEFLLRVDSVVPTNAWQVPVKVVTFDDLHPSSAFNHDLRTFQGIGKDPLERIYAVLCNDSGPGDCYLFRYDPETMLREYLGSLAEAARREGNMGPNQYWNQTERLVKGHTHVRYMDGKMWIGTMNAHDANDLSVIRGVHIFSFDLETEVITDHSVGQPKDIFLDRRVIYAMNVIPEINAVVAVGMPDCTLAFYDYETGETLNIAGGPDSGDDPGNSSGRDVAVMADGDILYQCRRAATPLAIYNYITGENRELDVHLTSPLWNGTGMTSDRNIAYISDYFYLYKFDTRDDSLEVIDTLAPDGERSEVWSLNISLDDKKLYYAVNVHPESGAKNSIRNDLYEYNLETGQRTLLLDLKPAIGTSAQVSGSHVTTSDGKVYVVFYSREENTSGIIEVDVSNRTGPPPTLDQLHP